MTSAAGQLDLRGGHPVIDFVNTVAWRGDATRRLDYLVDYSDLVAWSRHAGVLSQKEAIRFDESSETRALAAAKRLREALHALWAGDPAPPLDTITAAYSSALRRRQLRLVGDRAVWDEREVTAQTTGDRLAAAAVDLITEIQRHRIKQCDDSACGWLFLDSSHRQNRRWCSAADCGNRDRARRHYERSRG